MGSHRKNKTSNSLHQRRYSSGLTTTKEDETNSHQGDSVVLNGILQGGYDDIADEEGIDNTARSLDFSKVLQDVEGSLVSTMTSSVVAISGLLSSTPPNNNNKGGSFRVTWKELIYLLLAIVVLAGLSIFMGVAAGITISIHYFDTQATPSFPRLEARERELGPHQRVTTLDYSIASSNFLYPMRERPSGDDNEVDLTLGRVITMSESGQRSVLFVVEEIPALQQDSNQTQPNESLNVCTNQTTLDDSTDTELLLNGQYKPYKHRGPPDSRFQLTPSKVHPTVCSDGITIGFSDWNTLKAAVEEANALSAERFMKWNEYFASLDGSPISSDWFDKIIQQGASNRDACDDESRFQYYYDNDIVFTICPGTTLKARKGPIFINSGNIQIECGDPEEYKYMRASQQPTISPSPRSSFSREIPTCIVDVGGTHLAFGPHARNILVRGIVFQSAKTSSLAFHYDGAQASFEDCIWMDNAGVHGKYGAVADVNSTSIVNFYRCEIGSSLSRVANLAGGPGGFPIGANGESFMNNVAGGPLGNGMSPGVASFLSLRN